MLDGGQVSVKTGPRLSRQVSSLLVAPLQEA